MSNRKASARRAGSSIIAAPATASSRTLRRRHTGFGAQSATLEGELVIVIPFLVWCFQLLDPMVQAALFQVSGSKVPTVVLAQYMANSGLILWRPRRAERERQFTQAQF